jgi:hypothetical protein
VHLKRKENKNLNWKFISNLCSNVVFKALRKAESVKQKSCIATESLFGEKLREAVDETLLALGDSARDAIYYHLEKAFNVKRENIHEQVEEFAKALENMLGPGARLLEIQIMKSLHRKIRKPLPLKKKKDLTFTEYVVAAKKSLEQQRKG